MTTTGQASEVTEVGAADSRRRVTFPVAGMTCQACAQTVERALSAVHGVESAQVNYGSRTATLLRDPDRVDGEALARAVRAIGYEVPAGSLDGARDLAADVAFAEEAEAGALRRLQRDFLLSLVFGVGAVLAMRSHDGVGLTIALSGVVLWVAGWQVLSSGARAALRRAPDMNTLVGLGSLAAWLAALAAVARLRA